MKQQEELYIIQVVAGAGSYTDGPYTEDELADAIQRLREREGDAVGIGVHPCEDYREDCQ